MPRGGPGYPAEAEAPPVLDDATAPADDSELACSPAVVPAEAPPGAVPASADPVPDVPAPV
ncbi:MAG: hypothetical protein JO262_22920 [Solirubrobacterales bacterium]|nr:hypothetical protein [Solirubrobacterales bacterium]